MLKIQTIEIAGFGSALKALRLPFKGECKSDVSFSFDSIGNSIKTNAKCDIAERDITLLNALVRKGTSDAKVLRGVVVYAEIEAPIWFLRELETYRIGRDRLSSESTMHSECKGLSGEELEKAKDNIPMGHIQKTVDMYSYQCLRNIYFQRRYHRLPMWHDYCKWIESLPLSDKLITCEYERK